MRLYLFFLTLLFCNISFAQNSIKGVVTDQNNQPIPGANINIKDVNEGAVTELDGSFILITSKEPPFSVDITALGYVSASVKVGSITQKVQVKLASQETKLDEIVVSA